MKGAVMTSPVETIADALIAFIMSLLNDPEAAEEFVEQPHATLADNGLSGVCMADVAQVRPVIVDHPTVIHHQDPPPPPPPGHHHDPVHEIVRMIQQYTTVDARSTIIDQSVNQNIWTEGGDVTQLFDQEAVVASGDESVAAGNDASIVNSDTDITTGDVSIGNDEYNGSFNEDNSDSTDIDGSFQDNSTNDGSTNADVDDSFQDNSTDVAVDVDDSNVDDSAVVVEPAPAPAPVVVDEPADVLES